MSSTKTDRGSADVSTDAGPQEETANHSQVTQVIDSLEKEAKVDRCDYIKRRMEENRMKLAGIAENNHRLSVERGKLGMTNGGNNDNLLTKRMKDAIDMKNGDGIRTVQEEEHVSVVLLGHGIEVKNYVRSISLPKVEKIPPYTTWVFLDRNQRMTEDESVVGRRRLYYDKKEGETLICSDSEDETVNDKDKEEEFVESEDKIIRTTIEQTGSSEIVYNLLAQRLSRKPSEIKERHEALIKCSKPGNIDSDTNSFFDKDLEAAQGSLNKLFCRRCFIFGCKLHGCSQELIYPAKKKSSIVNNIDEENVPCGPHCYLQLEEKSGISPMELKSEQTTTFLSTVVTDYESWRTLEKSLLKMGFDIFGKNSCLIARNLMGDLKTCAQVYHVLQYHEIQERRTDREVESRENMGTALSKPAGSHAMRKQISTIDEDLLYHHYNPCGCQSLCGDDCSCLHSGTYCEKFCGCPKTCKSRFKGCHCVKGKCRTRQCPCFASNRECDPDVCRQCGVSCGENGLKCQNMKLLLKQQQRILLGRSNVSGWGIFLQDDVAKDEYLGEYTGELISHREANKRGKIYDRENSSFLFNLNNKLVVDGKRKSNKLKFLNHSTKPNCYAKVMMVAGDHRLGIFAKEKICAGEELLFDYCYDPGDAPSWAKKSMVCDLKRKDTASSSSGVDKKHS